MSYSLVVKPNIGRSGQITDTLSSYNPTGNVRARIQELKNEFMKAQEVRTRNYRELNYRSLSQYSDDCQDRFINYIQDDTQADPAQQWKANTVRPLTRNKVIEVAAYVTTRVTYPRVEAQNNKAEPDLVSATVMEDLMRWTNEQSNYDLNFMNSVISMLVFPATFIYEGYAEYFHDVKEVKEDGTWTTKNVKDDIYSGFQSLIVPWDELYIGNPYEPNIQKQPFVIWRRILDYSTATIKYGENKNFKYVRPGVRIYLDNNQSVYEQEDESINHDGVEELIYYNRLADLELTIVNGVMMCDPDSPIMRKDKRIPFSSSGYGKFDAGRFFYFKSLVDDLKPDQDQADQLINFILDGTYLKMMPPSILYGDEVIQTNVMIPGTVHPLNINSRLEPIQIAGDMNLGISVLGLIEGNAENSSKKDLSTSKQQTAYEISRVEEDIKTKLGLFGKMIAEMVSQYGQLRINTILEHLTVPQIGELTDSDNAVNYARFLIDARDGKNSSKIIEFTDEIPEEGMTEDQILQMSYELLDREGGKLDGNDKEIIKVQPKLFRELKYQVKIVPNVIFRTSEAADKAYNLELVDRLTMDPLADQNARFKLLIDTFRPGEVDRFKNKQPMIDPMTGQPMQPGQAPVAQPGGAPKPGGTLSRLQGQAPKAKTPAPIGVGA